MEVLKFKNCLLVRDAKRSEFLQVLLHVNASQEFYYFRNILFRLLNNWFGLSLTLRFLKWFWINLQLNWILLLRFVHCIRWVCKTGYERLWRFLRLFSLNSWGLRGVTFVFFNMGYKWLLVTMYLLILGSRAPFGSLSRWLHYLLLTSLQFFEFANLFELLLHFLRF